jgi:SPP1 family predicted phage head-tail adaptor
MSSLDDVLEFITFTETRNNLGDVITEPAYRRVFADKKSIRQSEFYAAQSSGLKPEVMFVVWSLDYQGEEHFRHNNRKYKVVRTFETNNEQMEIVGTSYFDENEVL